MKKRLFAGVLAFLMVIGLLPLSMWYKPVSAKAEDAGKQVFEASKCENSDLAKTGAANREIALNDEFTIYTHKNTVLGTASELKWEDDYTSNKRLTLGGAIKKDSKGISSGIKFSVKGSSIVKVWYSIGTTSERTLGIYLESKLASSSSDCVSELSVTKSKSSNKAEYVEFKLETDKSQEYFLGASNDKVYIYKIEVEEIPSYDIKVVDSKSSTKADGETTSVVEGKACTLEAADADNFLYWVNSNNRIVSRDAKYTFPVYYADTYTAVYKSTETTYKFMTGYDQVYKTYTSSNLEIPTAPVKYGNEFDYWKIGETKVETVSDIIAAGTDTDVEIKPVYKEVTEEVEITINDVTKKYKKNVDVTADATKLENFMYWYVTGDESKILSYNDLYSFYADDKITSITAKCGTDTVKKSGIITPLTNYINGNNKTFVFEFTVPEGCTIEFAGIVASSTSSTPTLTDCEYIRGRSSKAETYRYSWTKTNSVGTTWNVRPILKYSDGQGNVTTIISDDVQSL